MSTPQTEPRERPILFSGPMVRAILDGRKSQTRRVVQFRDFGKSTTPGYAWHFRGTRRGAATSATWQDLRHEQLLDLCPYGRAGDRLWVREKFLPCNGMGKVCKPCEANYVCYRDGGQKFRRSPNVFPWTSEQLPRWDPAIDRFAPSIHMPRWASRIMREITAVRVERLQEISEEDAIAEGIERVSQLGILRACGWKDYSGQSPGFFSPIDSYRTLWDSINGRKHPWKSNPWLWAVAMVE